MTLLETTETEGLNAGAGNNLAFRKLRDVFLHKIFFSKVQSSKVFYFKKFWCQFTQTSVSLMAPFGGRGPLTFHCDPHGGGGKTKQYIQYACNLFLLFFKKKFIHISRTLCKHDIFSHEAGLKYYLSVDAKTAFFGLKRRQHDKPNVLAKVDLHCNQSVLPDRQTSRCLRASIESKS